MNPPSETTTPPAAQVLDLLERQATLYRNLRRLTERQRQLIVRGQTGALLALLAERQKITAELSSLADALAPFRAEWQRCRQQLSSAQQRRVDELLTDVEAVVRELLATDEADAQLLAARKVSTLQSIGALESQRQAAVAYQRAGASVSCMTDEQT